MGPRVSVRSSIAALGRQVPVQIDLLPGGIHEGPRMDEPMGRTSELRGPPRRLRGPSHICEQLRRVGQRSTEPWRHNPPCAEAVVAVVSIVNAAPFRSMVRIAARSKASITCAIASKDS